jgi:hypothetical protein
MIDTISEKAKQLANVPVQKLAYETIEIYKAMDLECPLDFLTMTSNPEKLYTFNLRSRMIYSIWLYCWRIGWMIPFSEDTSLSTLEILHYELHKQCEKMWFGGVRETIKLLLDVGRPIFTQEMIPSVVWKNL